MRCRRQAPTGGTANPTLVGGTDDEAAQTPSGVGQEFLSVIWVGIWRIGRDEEASSERDKQLRAELAEGLGYFPASLAAGERRPVSRAGRAAQAREEAGIREGGHEHRWDHLREEKRRAEVEASDAHRWLTCTSEP